MPCPCRPFAFAAVQQLQPGRAVCQEGGGAAAARRAAHRHSPAIPQSPDCSGRHFWPVGFRGQHWAGSVHRHPWRLPSVPVDPRAVRVPPSCPPRLLHCQFFCTSPPPRWTHCDYVWCLLLLWCHACLPIIGPICSVVCDLNVWQCVHEPQSTYVPCPLPALTLSNPPRTNP